ncbi:Sodium/calcium exchanger protein [Candidatus Bilamarchaeum dharawalense]|uniref:Sodium/calcium exchanger protein n=1 Tax=Candidatus Bilamarchaeum dharawalense TaxID=2885759 RepID=A0A5E4LW53_9ARCH|nr:Sodium/calcium exchanger protein [Candidatus Bilamarchaeum dharawalense]
MRLMDLLLIFVPITLVLNFVGADSTVLFASSLFAILPLAAKMGEATEELAKIYGGQIGGLLNATFGNAAELIIALLAINRGLVDLVKASLAGSIIGNLLFVFGLSILLGGFRFKEQKFSAPLAGLNSTMLLIAFMSIMIPSLFHFVPLEHRGNDEVFLSTSVSVLLIVLYLLSMVFSLKTHNYLFRTKVGHEEKAKWSRNFAIGVLGVSTIVLALISEVFVGQIEHVALSLGLTELFIGAIVVALIGNAAEHLAAVSFALKNELDLSINVTVGSSLQIAMFVAPVAVIASIFMGKTMDLVFTPFEVIAVFASVLIVNEISSDGRCNWFEGAQLVIMYLIIAVLFFFVR